MSTSGYRKNKNSNATVSLLTANNNSQLAYSPFRSFVTAFINSDSVKGGMFAILTLC